MSNNDRENITPDENANILYRNELVLLNTKIISTPSRVDSPASDVIIKAFKLFILHLKYKVSN